jgi:hypothetical protein
MQLPSEVRRPSLRPGISGTRTTVAMWTPTTRQQHNLAATTPAEPELLAHHFTQAGLTEAAFEWWAKAGQRSLERSALVEAVDQFMRALGQIAALPATPAQRVFRRLSERLGLFDQQTCPLRSRLGFRRTRTSPKP